MSTATATKRVLKISEAASACGRAPKAVRNAIQAGELAAKRPWVGENAPYLIHVDALDEWIKSWPDACPQA